MLIIFQEDEAHYKTFANLNCVETCRVGEEFDAYARDEKVFYINKE